MERTPSPTPSSNAVTAAPDTVPRSRQTSAPLYRTGDLTYGREAVLRDLQSIFIVDLDYFKTAILPPLPDGVDIKRLRSSLIVSKKLTPAGQWAAFDVDPRVAPGNEDAVFRRLGSVFKDIVNEAQTFSQYPPTLQLELNPSVAPHSRRSNSSRPDAYLRLVKKKSVSSSSDPQKDSWDDIAVSFEFKKSAVTDGRVDNEKKIIWSMHHIMRSDPCRRATFGITIENTQTRLWFTCRSLTVVSQPFDFTKARDIGNVIHVFCCLAFAHDHELGWDPNIERVLVTNANDSKDDGDNVQYDIRIQGKVYRTVATISDFGAEAMRGRGTRVFEAYDRSHPDRHVVIKDAWRDSDRMREDHILSEILHDIQEKDGDEGVAAARKYFLTVLNAEDVEIHGSTDDTEQLLRGMALPEPLTLYDVTPDKAPSQLSHTSSAGNLPQLPFRRDITGRVSVTIHHKRHFRLVFAEVAEPAFQLKNLTAVTQTLGDAVKALKWLHGAGWVHRDISSGNVMRYNHQGLIVDLEYAKRMNSSDPSHDVRTGTADFMACEVEAQRYLFVEKSAKAGPRSYFTPVTAPVVRPPFRANPLHDLESLWWILMWVIHYHVDGGTQELPRVQEAAYRDYFPGLKLPPGQSRLGFLSTALNDDAFLPPFHPAVRAADDMRLTLFDSYRLAEKGLGPSGPNYHEPYSRSSVDFSAALTDLYAGLKVERAIDLVRLSDIKKREQRRTREGRDAAS
ncbi:hypothetical protein BU15DRAFT_53550 [Melanogaster broomeanus]|nr:hypothetical protein BU15DRAFT_53550 [Melanogaster broomeanus]